MKLHKVFLQEEREVSPLSNLLRNRGLRLWEVRIVHWRNRSVEVPLRWIEQDLYFEGDELIGRDTLLLEH